MNDECPCRYCVPPKRNATCHTDCPEYRKWNTAHKERNDIINNKKNEESEICKYIANRMYRARKGKQG